MPSDKAISIAWQNIPNEGGGWADWVAMELSTGAGFTSQSWPAATPAHMRNGNSGSDYRVLVGDFNGDGRDDMAVVSPAFAGSVTVLLAKAGSFLPGVTYPAGTSPVDEGSEL